MAKRGTQAADVIDVGAPIETEDEQLATTAGEAVRAFVAGVRGFFLEARKLEAGALATLAEAKEWRARPLASADEDLAVQKFILKTSAQNRAVVEHWKITTTIHAFHRRMTAKRGIAEKALDEANQIGNALHNAYVQEQNRKAAAEQERIRREAEQAAEAAKQRELDEMEAEAVRREEAAGGLSAREAAFVDLYSVRGDGQSAARAAGFKSPAKDSARLLTLPKIQAALEAKRSAAAIRQQADAVKRQPVIVDVPDVRPDVQQAAGSSSRKTPGSAELLDEQALIEAVISGKYGIPSRILRVDLAALNIEARSLETLINRWPGVRFKAGTPKVI